VYFLIKQLAFDIPVMWH